MAIKEKITNIIPGINNKHSILLIIYFKKSIIE